jgi:hypothetical protein
MSRPIRPQPRHQVNLFAVISISNSLPTCGVFEFQTGMAGGIIVMRASLVISVAPGVKIRIDMPSARPGVAYIGIGFVGSIMRPLNQAASSRHWCAMYKPCSCFRLQLALRLFSVADINTLPRKYNGGPPYRERDWRQ